MAREQVAGALVLDRLRERIVAGVYLGHWRPGDRLPSIREIAEAEDVDRKTAAAAYQRLQEEAIVKVRPRSGVYLQTPPAPRTGGPLDRLHRQWLAHAYEGARALGLDTAAILRLISAISELEHAPIPLLECTWGQAEALTGELRSRLGLNVVPALHGELRPDDPVLAEAPLVATTPYHHTEATLLAPGRLVVELTLEPEVLTELRRAATRGSVIVIATDEIHADKLRRAFRHCGLPVLDGAVQVVPGEDRDALTGLIRAAEAVFPWPGAADWIADTGLVPKGKRLGPSHVISTRSVARIQNGILDAAIRQVKAGARPRTPGAEGVPRSPLLRKPAERRAPAT